MELLDIVAEHWAWSGIDANELVVSNDFANLILKDKDNQFWRLCPEDVYCTVVADSIEAYNQLIQDEEFLEDWHMIAMLSQAKIRLGELAEGEKFCLKVPGILGGDYVGKNVIKAPLEVVIASAGRLGKHIADKAEGTKIDLKEVDYLSDY
ncbi:MAG: T6SS immunity protein Tdi1 domain-containing protein [Granulosicoccaceae bacterium]